MIATDVVIIDAGTAIGLGMFVVVIIIIAYAVGWGKGYRAWRKIYNNK